MQKVREIGFTKMSVHTMWMLRFIRSDKKKMRIELFEKKYKCQTSVKEKKIVSVIVFGFEVILDALKVDMYKNFE